jgi:hypothetical protein
MSYCPIRAYGLTAFTCLLAACAGGGSTGPKCGSNGASCMKGSDCCSGICTGNACASEAPDMTYLADLVMLPDLARMPFGEACMSGDDCASRVCWLGGDVQGFCSIGCRSDPACSAQGNYYCIPDSGASGAGLCESGCGNDGDCASLNSNWTCNTVSTVAGGPQGICGLWVDRKPTESCRSNGQCLSGTCFGWCTRVCSSDVDCGVSGACLMTQQGIYYCYPQCVGNVDCDLFGNKVSCKGPYNSINGHRVNACST